MVTSDDYEGPAMADYLLQVLKVTKVAVGSDNGTYGKGIADNFSAEFKAGGGTLVGTRNDYDAQNTNDFKTWLTQAKAAGVQGIYAGGVTSTKVCNIRAQMKGIFDLTTPFGGGVGIAKDSECVKAAADMSPNVYASIAAGDSRHVPSAAATIAAYERANPDPNDYTV